MPKSYMNEEDRWDLSQNALFAAESAAAARAGDHDTALEWLQKAEIPASALLAAKRCNGADWIKRQGLRTETAEREYGRDWLDRDI